MSSIGKQSYFGQRAFYRDYHQIVYPQGRDNHRYGIYIVQGRATMIRTVPTSFSSW
jgi:hypothetical protein